MLYGYLESLWLNDVLRKSHECEQKSLEPSLDSALGTPEHTCPLTVLLAVNIYKRHVCRLYVRQEARKQERA